MLLLADDNGVVCCNPKWLQRRVYGNSKVPATAIQRYLQRYRIEGMIDTPTTDQSSLTYCQITKFPSKQGAPRKIDRQIEKKDDERLSSDGDPDWAGPTWDAMVMGRLMEPPFYLGQAKAMEYAKRITLDDLPDWQRFLTTRDMKLAWHWMSKVNNPKQIPDVNNQGKPRISDEELHKRVFGGEA
jgi:hypothetical protein